MHVQVGETLARLRTRPRRRSGGPARLGEGRQSRYSRIQTNEVTHPAAASPECSVRSAVGWASALPFLLSAGAAATEHLGESGPASRLSDSISKIALKPLPAHGRDN